jgi:acetyl-CoA/propionyl-CoA carboxylase biotin carboxyl carrier protein
VQVEHTVTELATGIDIVHEQIRIAAGEPISFPQESVSIRGSAIECRINAEAPPKKFAPSPGKITRYREPGGPGVRVDSGVEAGSEITPLYDPLIAKLIVAGVDRQAATRRMLRALDEFEIEGVTSLIPFHKALLRSEQWARGETCRDLVEDPKWLKTLAPEAAPAATEEQEADEEQKVEREYTVEVNNRRFSVKVIGSVAAGGASANSAAPVRRPPRRERARTAASQDGASETLVSPIQGTVLRVNVEKGQEVDSGAVICVVEAMKMENEITAHRAGKVAELNVSEGGSIASGDTIAVIK